MLNVPLILDATYSYHGRSLVRGKFYLFPTVKAHVQFGEKCTYVIAAFDDSF